MDVKYRKTRFVCLSDTHGHTPGEAGFRLPAGDVLIHAGDLTNQGSKSELQKTMKWIRDADYEVKIVVAGNHDITLDPKFYAEYGAQLHNQNLEQVDECMDIVQNASPSIIFLNHTSKTVRLVDPNGPRTTFKIFGSPFSRFHGNWAFGYDATQSIWAGIPADVDILVTHTPPYSHCDRPREPDGPASETSRSMPFGCKGLLTALRTTRPLLAVCGHIHDGRGFERVHWNDAQSSSPSDGSGVTETSTPQREDETDDRTEIGNLPLGRKKQGLIDLTGKKHRKLDNISLSTRVLDAHIRHERQGLVVGSEDDTKIGVDIYLSQRKETCIVNAAIMATKWPHRGGKRFNPPIVVDLNLPPWIDGETGNNMKTGID